MFSNRRPTHQRHRANQSQSKTTGPYRSKIQAWVIPLFVCPLIISSSQPAVGANPPEVVQSSKPETNALLLPAAFDEGLVLSPRTAAIRLQLGITKSNLIRATEMPNPTIFMDNGYKAEFTYRYGVTIPIEPPWKLALRVVLAKNQIKQTDFEILKALWIYRANVRRAYTDYVVAQELDRTYADLADLTAQLQGIARKRVDAGESAELDVYRAEQEAAKATANKEQQKYLVLAAQQRLAVILGRNPDAELSVPLLPPDGPMPKTSGILPVSDVAFPTLTNCLDLALKNRPELKVARQAVKTQKAGLKMAAGNIMPNPTIGVGSSVVNGPGLAADATIRDVGKNIFHGYFFQIYQELPLLNFQQGDISMYRANVRQLQSEVLAQENLVTEEVASAYQRLAGARRKIEIYQERLLERTIEIVRMSRLGYQVGQTDINAVILAQQAAVQIKTEYLTAVTNYQQAFTDLEQSIGTTLQ